MTTNMILALQSVLISVQIVNGAVGTTIHNPVLSLCIGAFVGGFQFFVQHVGNQTTPTPKQ